MIQLFILMCILTIFLDVINAIYIPKCKLKMERYLHALLPSVISTLCAMFYFMIVILFRKDVEMLSSLNIITNIVIAYTFLIVNAFVIISKGIDEKKDNEVSLGLFFIFLSPIIFLVSLPLELTFYIVLKLRKTKEKEIKVTEEELFSDILSCDEYSNNEISVSEYINELKYNSNNF